MKVCKKCSAVFEGQRCKPCKDAYSAAWRAANPERVKQNTASYYKKNSLLLNQKASDWRAKNPEKRSSTDSAWRRANPELCRIYIQNRRVRKKNVGGRLSKNIAKKLFALQKGKCACCKKPLGDDYHMDHIIPLSKGGANEDLNMQLLTAKCNLQKGTIDPIEFMQLRGFLL